MGTFLLFVYGTLKRDGVRHPHLAGSRFVGPAATLPRYALYDLGAYPGMKHGDGVVSGELFEVDRGRIPQLDAVEGAPDLFRLEEVEFPDGRALAYLFVPGVEGRPRIAGGVWHNVPPALGGAE
jgi:gamma-glutamylcyclotransferase (GGCT)/AIG2-like uncharacterized protein YtfP